MGWKEAYQEKADAQLRSWQARMDRFIEEPVGARPSRLEDRRAKIQRIRAAYDEARSRLDALKASADSHWEEEKRSVELSMIALKRALDESGAGPSGGSVHLRTNRSHVYEPFSRKE